MAARIAATQRVWDDDERDADFTDNLGLGSIPEMSDTGAEQEPRRRSHSLTTPLGDVEEYFEPATPSKRGDRVVEWYKLEQVSVKRRDIFF